MTAPTPTPTLALVTFYCHGFRFAVEAAGVRSMLPANQGQGSPAVLDWSAIFSLSGEGGKGERCLVVRTTRGEVTLLVEDPVCLIQVAAQTIYLLPPLVKAWMPPFVKALLYDEEGMGILCDVAQTGDGE